MVKQVIPRISLKFKESGLLMLNNENIMQKNVNSTKLKGGRPKKRPEAKPIAIGKGLLLD